MPFPTLFRSSRVSTQAPWLILPGTRRTSDTHLAEVRAHVYWGVSPRGLRRGAVDVLPISANLATGTRPGHNHSMACSSTRSRHQTSFSFPLGMSKSPPLDHPSPVYARLYHPCRPVF